MRLEDYLQLHQGEVVKIGMSSGFIYADTITEETKGIIEKMSEEEEANLKRMHRVYKAKLKELKSLVSKMDEFLKELDSSNTYNTAYFRAIKNTNEVALTKVKVSFYNAERKLKAFSPFLGRIVLEEYKSVTENALITIVSGNESGRYWTVEEYRNGIEEDPEEGDEDEV